MSQRAELLSTWAAGWAAGAILGGLAASEGLGGGRYLLLALCSVFAVAIPTYRGAKAQGSRHPITESVVWAVGVGALLAAVAVYAHSVTALASPGDLNINTTETMRQRQLQFDWGGLRADIIVCALAGVFWFQATAIVSAYIGYPSRSVAKYIVFSLWAVLACAMGAFIAVLVAPILGHLLSVGARGPAEYVGALGGIVAGAALAGTVAGAGIEYGRTTCFAESSGTDL